MNETILIVEDDQKLRSGLRDNLEFDGYQVIESWNFAEALEKWKEEKPALVILDLMLPGRSGYQLLKEMRACQFKTPVIILSARGELWDKVKGFRLGCDDYVVKPFSIIELLARIQALLKRSSPQSEPPENISFSDVKLNVSNRMCKVKDIECDLPIKEFELLFFLITNPGRVISRKELLQKVWNSSPEIVTRTVDVYISALRQKLHDSECEIETVYKVGYRLRK
ncbi:response regulator transcription factor [bacterium]|nr:response regulator transcription factor [bacterium]